ncbi:-Thioredoxin domain-containing protein 9 [Babesia bigemina]|uniref:-Thioredoxin domain-containing protein 9 n=1 Tax=Babesia bigemina TaxID=5866 RepID=A0A061DDS3_BABBI|nr:-Thioredoxin domain-containing protein 9 [Babesia bigemina]XP_012769839.1 -Thioredoxin domain-containing protein 9 [Babesia bigemina]CDR97649.1 -Thioredoxin domain-containing protein 9 [Babesia bigemina]CDR97653.1 -Thioredoxin domain-containing protein 9 [Babesia bigemina]|eukprot:XP_012769835.1 -Thioredoxin domain-containing protein 9 [Babesia bigemina]
MAPTHKESELVRKVHDNVLAALLQKEREVEDELESIRHVESKIAHMRDEDALERFREARLQALKETHAKRLEFMNKGYGKLVDVHSDSDFFDVCRNAHYVVAHFYRPTTVRSQYLDGKMHELCQTYFDTKFIRVNAERTPFLCERFNIWCIPTVSEAYDSLDCVQLMIIIGGKTNHSIIGFDEFGGDGFTLDEFASALKKRGILPPDAENARNKHAE